MAETKNYFHDKVILLLLGANFFVAFLVFVLVLLQIGNVPTNNYIIERRFNLGLSGYKVGGVGSILEFLLFAGLVLVISILLSIRTYRIERQLAIIILSMGALLLVIAAIVSTALLGR